MPLRGRGATGSGAADRIRNEVKIGLHPGTRQELEPLVERLRRRFGEQGYEAERNRDIGSGWYGAVREVLEWAPEDVAGLSG